MKFRLFQYSFPAPAELEDLNSFLNSNRVATVTQHLVQSGGSSMLVFVVSTPGGSPASGSGGSEPKVDYRELLKAEEFSVFSRMRDLRKKWSEAEGVPLYSIFTNAQLADMVQRRASSLADLKSIEGVGHARVDKYGSQLLPLLAELPQLPPASPPEKKATA